MDMLWKNIKNVLFTRNSVSMKVVNENPFGPKYRNGYNKYWIEALREM